MTQERKQQLELAAERIAEKWRQKAAANGLTVRELVLRIFKRIDKNDMRSSG